MMSIPRLVTLFLRASAVAWLVLTAAPARAQTGGVIGPPATPTPRQTQADDYTSYELLAPSTHQFRILYDVTATTGGARYFWNVIRKGSEASDERVIDLATSRPLAFEVVSGERARANGHTRAELDTDYIQIGLARPVPAGGEQRLRIDKTYKDAKSYYADGDTIVFERSLGIKRNKIVLPAGYALVACNMPSQIFQEPDGRLAVSFMNLNPDAVSLVIKARPWSGGTAPVGQPGVTTTPRASAAASAGAAVSSSSPVPAPTGPVQATDTPPRDTTRVLEQSAASRVSDRAFQDREIVYFLQPPETHTFSLYHDYTESRVGMDKYLNVVRAGSTVSNPSAISLDTGEALKVETLKGDAISKAAPDIGEPVTADSEVVVIRYPPVAQNQSIRLRISETYTDPGRYGLVGDVLVWRRSFGRPRNAVVLPAGWMVTASSVPARVSLAEDGRVRLDLDNPRTDEIDVLIRARR